MNRQLEGIAQFGGHMTDEVHLASDRRTWQQINDGLFAQAPNEACVFVLTRPSRGVIRTTVILGEILWPVHGEVKSTPRRLEISSDYISRVLDSATDAGPSVGICLVHTHPKSNLGEGVAEFSPRDDWYEQRLFPTLIVGRQNSIAASIVLGSSGDVNARVWWQGNGGVLTQNAHAVRIVGPELTIIETPSSCWTDHPDPLVMDRSTRLWGKEGRRRLQNLRAGFVGCGGTGSISIFALATMGIGKMLAWDKDIAAAQNRHRTAGITKDYIGEPKVIALKALAESVATAEPFEMKCWQDWGTTTEGLKGLKDCDIIFCCVDKFAPRVPLNDLAYAHLIPTFDMSSWIHFDENKQVDALMTHAHVWSPGIPCAWCRETLSSRVLIQEAQGNQRDIENRAPYGMPIDETDGVEPSVLPLNMLGVSLALMQFMQVALKITDRTPRDLKFFLPNWELDESDRTIRPDCECISSIGAGDTFIIRPVTMD
jgi:hypothetical protein